MDIQKRIETTFALTNVSEEAIAVIVKGLNMAVTAGRVGTVRVSLLEKKMMRAIANQLQAAHTPIPREMIEDEDEPEDEEDDHIGR